MDDKVVNKLRADDDYKAQQLPDDFADKVNTVKLKRKHHCFFPAGDVE